MKGKGKQIKPVPLLLAIASGKTDASVPTAVFELVLEEECRRSRKCMPDANGGEKPDALALLAQPAEKISIGTIAPLQERAISEE